MIFENIDELKKTLEKEGRIMALDIGTKTIGVAISDISQTIASPKTTINRKSNQIDFPILEKLITENNIKTLILGFPLEMNDTENKMCRFVKRFANNFDEFTHKKIKISFFDERLSSFAARDTLHDISNLDQQLWNQPSKNTKRRKIYAKNAKKKGLIDQIAAGIILQSTLSYFKNGQK